MKPRLNHQIRVPEVRIVEYGVISHARAMELATEQGVDLIETVPQAKPPVCILETIGKWRYIQDKKAKANKQTVQEMKTIQIRPVTEQHDLQTKARQIQGFLEDGHKVQLVVKLRGREMAHEKEAQDKLDELLGMFDHVVDRRSGLENRQIVAIVSRA